MHNLTTLIKRLEAATSRLEDIATSSASFDQPRNSVADLGATHLPSSSSAPELPGIAKDAQQPSAPAAPALQADTTPKAIQEMDRLIDEHVAKFVSSASGLDKNIETQAHAVERAFATQRHYLVIANKAKKPDMTSPAFSELIKDLQQEMGTVNDIKDSNRASPFKDHLNMVAEGMGGLQWVVFEGKPADYVAEILGGVQLFGNRVLKEYKEKDPKHVAYVQSYYAIWKNLQSYIRNHYAAGVTWNAQGMDLAKALKDANNAPSSSQSAPAPPGAAGGPPPPPPPPPLPTFDNAPPPPPPANKSTGGDMGAVFDQLNRGESVTAGLRKVDKSEMTHKNPSLRTTSTVTDRKGSQDSITRSRSRGPELKPKPDSIRGKGLSHPTPKREPKKELDGNKWIIENFEDADAPIEVEVSVTQSILVTKCKNATIRLIGKANAISIDNSPRTNLVIDDLISSVDVIKCPNFGLQVLGSLPTVMLDQVDGASIYLSKESLNTEIYTSKCASINVNLPPQTEQDDYKECPLPEQFRTFVKDGKLVSEIVEHAG
ncbi:adenylate cyclase-associated protein [Aureobasidium namibiae CBS 147.97]|uniref:Adenylyl cyclase-associated protein n=1 Tax=Aureobasidium namibiae CBS 147.97 TaxID=1043004 RepID=A0A074WA61_9PEZI|nr:adenylate cyclase-associated protein [Aureobasidium namibiae CBS 147.97]KEQ69793.1 adenylate cyclase-associated protein [Aureobasidium namibiae CBS 147.97]